MLQCISLQLEFFVIKCLIKLSMTNININIEIIYHCLSGTLYSGILTLPTKLPPNYEKELMNMIDMH